VIAETASNRSEFRIDGKGRVSAIDKNIVTPINYKDKSGEIIFK
jgi:hypothetical protein